MYQSLLIDRVLASDEDQGEASLHDKVPSRVKAGPNVTISDNQSALLISQESFAVRAREKQAIACKAGRSYSMEYGIDLHTIFVELTPR